MIAHRNNNALNSARQRQTARSLVKCRGAKLSTSLRTSTGSQPPCDLVLSSGFLAFASHTGFLQAVEEAGVRVSGVMGTSAGALAGSLYAAGYSPKEVAAHLRAAPPIRLLRPSLRPWRGGLLSLNAVVARLAELLPPTFEDLELDFAVGVVTPDGRHAVVDSGPLPEAVAASAAIPFVFAPVDVPGGPTRLRDGGVVDRIGLSAWRDRRRRQQQRRQQHEQQQQTLFSGGGGGSGSAPPHVLLHVIARSSPFSGADDPAATGEAGVTVVRSPKSGVSFLDLGDFDAQFDAARRRARPTLEQWLVSAAAAAPLLEPPSLAAAAAAAAATAPLPPPPVAAPLPVVAAPQPARPPLAPTRLAGGSSRAPAVVVAAARARGGGGSGGVSAGSSSSEGSGGVGGRAL